MFGSPVLLLHVCMPSSKDVLSACPAFKVRHIWCHHITSSCKAPTFCMLYCCSPQIDAPLQTDAPLLQEGAVEWASEHPLSVDAILTFDNTGTDQPHYTIRGNHTDLPSTRLLYNEFDLLPDPQYKLYWLFVNLQQSLDRCGLSAKCMVALLCGVIVCSSYKQSSSS